MHYWPDHPNILAGRDEQAGGTWLGVGRDGRFCAVTNLRTGTPLNPTARTRGELIPNFLDSAPDSRAFSRFLAADYDKYNPFNLVFGDRSRLEVFSSADGRCRSLAPGIHSVSNGLVDEAWPLFGSWVARLSSLVAYNAYMDIDRINNIMHDETRAEDHLLPDTGLNHDTERQLSSIFIRGAEYGTRTTSILLFGEREINVFESNYRASGAVSNSTAFCITA